MLEEFAKIGNEDLAIRRKAGSVILAHSAAGASEAELDYVVKRLVRGLESTKATTRSGSYSTLASFLGLKRLRPGKHREVVAKTLLTDGQTSKKERRLVYLARILAAGVVVRNVPLPDLLQDEDLLKGVLNDLVDCALKRATLAEVASPFICHLLSDPALDLESFERIVWPCLDPLFAKSGVKVEEDDEDEDSEDLVIISPAALIIALSCSARDFKNENDFAFLKDVEEIVNILLTPQLGVADLPSLTALIISHVQKLDLVPQFWDALASAMKSSHFETVCITIHASVEAGLPQSLFAKKPLVASLLGVFRSEDNSQQQSQAVTALGDLLKWRSEEGKMRKKERKAVMKVLFSGAPNLLHEYHKLIRIINPFLSKVCTERDFGVLESIVRGYLEDEEETEKSVRMTITSLQFLSRIAQGQKASLEVKLQVSKTLLSIALGERKFTFQKKHKDKEMNGHQEEDEEENKLIASTASKALKSILASTYNQEFMDGLFDHVVEAHGEGRKLLKKVKKARKKVEDLPLKYLLGAYLLRYLVEEGLAAEETMAVIEELLEMSKSEETPPELSSNPQFLLNSVIREELPPFDYEALFSRFIQEGKVSEELIQAFAEAIDVEVLAEGDDEEDEDSDDESDEENNDDKMDTEEEEKEEEIEKKSSKMKNVEENDDDESDDGEDSIDMDEATEEELASMDSALAKVFATKKKVKEEKSTETRFLMRILRLVDMLLSRSSKKQSPISLPLILLMPLIHSLQASIRSRDKTTTSLSGRLVAVLNRLNSIKKFDNEEAVEKGTLLIMTRDLVSMSKQGTNKILADLLGDSVVTLTKAYLTGKRSLGEDTGFTTLYTGLLDLKGDSRKRNVGIVSSVISSALTTLPEWEEGKAAIASKLVSTVFDPTLRHFRRMQLLTLLRAVMADKTSTSSEHKWKVGAVKSLMTHVGGKSMKDVSSNKDKNFLKEALRTLIDASKDHPAEVEKSVEEFFKKCMMKNEGGNEQLRTLLTSLLGKHPSFKDLVESANVVVVVTPPPTPLRSSTPKKQKPKPHPSTPPTSIKKQLRSATKRGILQSNGKEGEDQVDATSLEEPNEMKRKLRKRN